MTITGQRGRYSLTGEFPFSTTVGFSGGCGSRASLAPQFYNDQPDAATATAVKLKAGIVIANIDATMRPGGTLSGVVTDHGGHRLNGVCVGVATPAQAQIPDFFLAVTFTRAGRYSIKDLAPGAYGLDFSCSRGRWASQWFKSKPDSESADLIAVDSGVTTAVNAKVSPAGSISGKVSGLAGRPREFACVRAVHAGDAVSDVEPATGEEFGRVTSRGGRYKFTGLAPGRYFVQFQDCSVHPRFGSQLYKGKQTFKSATPVRVTSGRTTSGINATMTPGGTISGVVRTPAGKPAAGVCVDAFDASSSAFGFSVTGTAGGYTLQGLATGLYVLRFDPCGKQVSSLAVADKPGLVRVTAPRATKDADIKLQQAGQVTGTVLGGTPGTPPLQVCALIVPANPNGSTGFAVAGVHGRYRIGQLAPGKYQVNFGDQLCGIGDLSGIDPFAAQWFSGQPTRATAHFITVTAGHTLSAVGATLHSLASITGTVTDSSHQVVPGECVTAVPFREPIDPSTGVAPPREIAISATSGSFRLSGLQPGKYKVEFSAGCGDSGFATQWWNNAKSAATATVITATSDTGVTGINVILHR